MLNTPTLNFIKQWVLNPIILIIILSFSLVASFILALLQFIQIWGGAMRDTQLGAMQQLGFISADKKPKIKK